MDVFKLKRFTDEGLLSDTIRAEQLIAPVAVDDQHKIFLCDDKTLGFCFDCLPLIGGGEKEHSKLDQLFSQNYPANMTMSFRLFRSPDLEEQLLQAERMRFGLSIRYSSRSSMNACPFCVTTATETLSVPHSMAPSSTSVTS